MKQEQRVIPNGSVIEQMFYAVFQEYGTEDEELLEIRIPMARYRELHVAVMELQDERERARRLAARLEEVVAMRTHIVQALADRDPDYEPIQQMIALQAWARAQLQEVP